VALGSVVAISLFMRPIDPLALDAARMNDMRALQKALAAYHDENDEYPPTPSTVDCDAQYNNVVALDEYLSPKYIKRIPKDPNPETCEYNYLYGSDEESYSLLVHLDNLNQWCIAATGGPSPELNGLSRCP
jgi:hypothetical protein